MGFMDNEESTMRFAEEIGLIPSRTSVPPHHCGVPMKINKCRDASLGWLWVCAREKDRKVKGRTMCGATINPVRGTVFDNIGITMGDYIALIYAYTFGLGPEDVSEEFHNRRRWTSFEQDDEEMFSIEDVQKFYQIFIDAEKIILSHENLVKGGPGKTVKIDISAIDTYHNHRRKRSTVLTLSCGRDQDPLHIPVKPLKLKGVMWPFIRPYVKTGSKVKCTDEARKFFDKKQTFNTAESNLEKLNGLLEASLPPRIKAKDIQGVIDAFIYENRFLDQYREDRGSKIQKFLEHLIQIYPPYVGGIIKKPLTLKVEAQAVNEAQVVDEAQTVE